MNIEKTLRALKQNLITRRSLKLLFRMCVRFHIYFPIIWFYKNAIRPIGSQDGRFTVLAINVQRFRGDLEVLSQSPNFRVCGLSVEWLSVLLPQFYPGGIDKETVYFPERNEEQAKHQENYRNFLREFLPRLYGAMSIDCVLGGCVAYLQDRDWGAVTHEIGTPYIVFHKENLIASRGLYSRCEEWARSLNRFEGTHIIVHNPYVAKAFTESGYVSKEMVSACGSIRMEPYLARLLDEKNKAGRGRKLVTFFSFFPGIGLGQLLGKAMPWPDKSLGIGYFKAFEEAHCAFAELARDRPDIDVLIKPKWGGAWLEVISDVLGKSGLDIETIPNLTVDAAVNAQDVILDSAVVVGYGSTVLLESAIAGKPVVMPILAEMREEKYDDYIFFGDVMDEIFDVVREKSEIRGIIESRLIDPTINSQCMARRRDVFSQYVSPIEGGALELYEELIISHIEAGRSK